jgi:hypothetical protein
MAVDADPGTTLPAPATALPVPLDLPGAASAAVRELVAVPGATYAAAVDDRSGALLAESGAVGSGAALAALLAWARRAAALPGPDGLDDLVVTTDRAFHVIRLGTVAGVPVWAYLRVDRKRGNLALARRAGPSPPDPARPPPGPAPGPTAPGPPCRGGRRRPCRSGLRPPCPHRAVPPRRAPCPCGPRPPRWRPPSVPPFPLRPPAGAPTPPRCTGCSPVSGSWPDPPTPSGGSP